MKVVILPRRDYHFRARFIADQLGHTRPSMTQDACVGRYMGRKLVDRRAVEALKEVFGPAELIGDISPLEGKGVGYMWATAPPWEEDRRAAGL